MKGFVTGVLEENRAGATYEGIVYDRFLKLRHASGRLLSIYDMDSLSKELPTGAVYQVVLMVGFFTNLELLRSLPDADTEEIWYGQVLDLSWQAQRGDYRLSSRSLFEYHFWKRPPDRIDWALVETPVGDMLMGVGAITQETGGKVEVGSILQWAASPSRFDLLAVV